MRKRVLGAAAVVAAACVVAAGVAWAGIPGQDGVIHGCYLNRGGAVRVIDPSVTKCRAWETAIEWSVTGPQGEQGLPGEQGPAGPTLGYYTQGQDVEVPITPDGTQVLELTLPDIQQGSGYLLSATFELVNYGPVDAQVNCGTGNHMGHELMVPVDQRSDPDGAGLWASNISTFTLTGMQNFGGGTGLGCQIVGWVGSPDGPAPDVRLRRGSLEAVYVSELDDQTPG